MSISNKTFDHNKYQAFPTIALQQRQWPNNSINRAPKWCSVDLRDGNQALVNPLSVKQKLKLFTILVEMGFKEIEVGFPSASQDDFDFVQMLINEEYIPEDVTIAILTPAREQFIKRSFEALMGAKKAIIHLYNSTSRVQREKVFKMDKEGISNIAVNAAKLIKQCANKQPETKWQFQYSPESFTGTELDYAVEICNAVIDVWKLANKKPIIINLPSTVEMSMPNIYADQIEWFCSHINKRKDILISVHTHNDRGCAVAAAEMALLAGADRVEGTLLGNGERTGNMDIITMAMNLYSQGINPGLDLSNIQIISEEISQLINIPVHPRHPYIGDLVFTAFSGSHQDAIGKCLKSYNQGDKWDIAYLPIDPADLGRSYQEIIRINSQSGKGGITYIIEQNLSIQLPRWLQIEFSKLVQLKTEQSGTEMTSEEIIALFTKSYLNDKGLLHINFYNTFKNYSENKKFGQDITEFVLSNSAKKVKLQGRGVGILDSFTAALSDYYAISINIIEYNEQTIFPNSSSQAISFINLQIEKENFSGVAQHEDIVMASLNAILQGISEFMLNREVADSFHKMIDNDLVNKKIA